MLFAPGLVVTASCFAGYSYWRFAFRQVTEAIRMEGAGRYDEARALFEGFLKNRNPLTSRGEAKWRCHLLLARLERKLGRYEEAARAADPLLDAPCSTGLRLSAIQLQADALAWAGELDRALDEVNLARSVAERERLNNFLGEIDGLRARILTWKGDLESARRIAEPLLEKNGPTALYAHLRLSEIERVLGRFPEAIEWAYRLTERLKDRANADRAARQGLWNALAHYHAARAAWLGGDVAQAAQFLLLPDAAKQMPRADAVGWWGLRAVVAFTGGDAAAAAEFLEAMNRAAKAAAPGFGARAWMFYYRAQMQMTGQEYGAAAENLTEAIRSDPPGDARAEMCYSLAQCLEKIGKGSAEGAYRCGASGPTGFYFVELCRKSLDGGAGERVSRYGGV